MGNLYRAVVELLDGNRVVEARGVDVGFRKYEISGQQFLVNGVPIKIKGVSGTGEGRHVTVRRELIRLEGGALVIDNPGMREFGILGAASGIESSYGDITTLASTCRYRNCSHTGEPGCAVLEAVNSGKLSREQYESYQKLRGESEFYDMSYAQKRKKDRDFGRFLKSAKKDFRDE